MSEGREADIERVRAGMRGHDQSDQEQPDALEGDDS
jgi:hypothetical protein